MLTQRQREIRVRTNAKSAPECCTGGWLGRALKLSEDSGRSNSWGSLCSKKKLEEDNGRSEKDRGRLEQNARQRQQVAGASSGATR